MTQFTISESYVFQDGIVLTAGKGVTYVTVNPLPIRIVDNHKTGLSLSSIAYNISLQKGVSSSVSGTGSTIVSMTMTNSRSTNYTLGSSYIFNGTLGQVKCIKLDKYNYTIHSSYSKYWADTFFTEMNNEIAGNNFSSFNIQNAFQFTMLNNKETVNISRPVDLYSLNIRYISFNVDSI